MPLRARRPNLPCLDVSAAAKRLADEATTATVRVSMDHLAERDVRREFHLLDELVRQETRETVPRLCHYSPGKDFCDDIVPYVDHRAETLEGGYVNASLMSGSLVHNFIAAQGPLKDTVTDFWSMIVNHHVTRIVALCADRECATYLPDGSEPLSLLDGTIKVRFRGEEPLTAGGDLWHSRFEVSCGEESWEVRRLHCSSWNDEDVCSIETLLCLAELVSADAAAAATVVHCRAGAGRTGSFIALCSLLADVKSQLRKLQDSVPCVSVARTVVDLRKHRPQMVQTWQQYALIYNALGQWFRSQCTGQSHRDDYIAASDGHTPSLPDAAPSL